MEVVIAARIDRLDLIVGREPITERTRILDELGHPSAPIEVFERFHDSLSLGLCLHEAHGFFQFILGNIYSGLHTSILNCMRIQIKLLRNL